MRARIESYAIAAAILVAVAVLYSVGKWWGWV